MFGGNWRWLAVVVLLVMAATWLYGTPPVPPALGPPQTPAVKHSKKPTSEHARQKAPTAAQVHAIEEAPRFSPPLLPAPSRPEQPAPAVADEPSPLAPTPLPPPSAALKPTQTTLETQPPQTPQPATSPSDAATLRELLQLRELIGSPLKGTSLDDSKDNNFADFLRRAIADDSEAQDAFPEEPLAFDTPPPSRSGPDAGAAAVAQLRNAASALDRHSDQLQEDLPARSRRLRTLANQLRQEADEIEELHSP